MTEPLAPPNEMLKERLQDRLFRTLLERIDNGTATSSDLNVAVNLLKSVGVDRVLSEQGTGKTLSHLAGRVLPFNKTSKKDADAEFG